MPHQCPKCCIEFRDQSSLKRHLIRKKPCVIEESTLESIICPHCKRNFASKDNRSRHIKLVCKKAEQIRYNDQVIHDQMALMQKQIDELIDMQKKTDNQPIIALNGGNVNNTMNNLTVNIAPWGSPLNLTDADVEAALRLIPGLVGTPSMKEVVNTLMELVKRAHIQEGARNVYLSPKREDWAMALQPTGWAAIPIPEVTSDLFDMASKRISSRTVSPRTAVPNPVKERLNSLQMEVPVQYRLDKENAVQMGMRMMATHLVNLRPGGPGPAVTKLIENDIREAAEAATAAAASTAASAAAAAEAEAGLTLEKLKGLLRVIPARYLSSGALDRDWIVRLTQHGKVSATDFYKALEMAAEMGECLAEWQGMLIYIEEKTKIHSGPPASK